MSHLLRQSSLRMRVGLAIVALISAGSILAGPRLARRLNPEPAPVATAVPPSLAGLAEAAVPALIAPEAPPVDDAPVGDQAIALGELTLRISADPWQLSVLDPDGAVLWEETPDEPLGFATSDGSRYRALRLEAITGRPTGGVAVAAATDDPDGRRLLVEAIPGGARAFRLTLAVDGATEGVSLMGAIVTAPDEHLVGFGERFTGVDQRGNTVDVWAEDRVVAKYGESSYAPLPLLMSSRGYGIALLGSERARFDLAATRADRWTWRQDTALAGVLVTYGPTLRDLVQRHAALTGLPPLPPPWAFGVWKAATGGQEHVLAEARRLRELGVPVSAVFAYDTVDDEANIGWPSVNYGGRFAGPYPDPAEYTAALHRLGMKALTYAAPDFHLDRANYAAPAELGYLVRDAAGEPYVHPGFQISWLDVAAPNAVAWWSERWRRALVDLGYDGAMLDLGELLPADARFGDGTPGSAGHNRYPLLYARAAWLSAQAARPDGDFVLFARSAAIGAQRYQSLQWPGDPRMRWEAPDGLQSLLPAALSTGLGGFPYWHPEVAGYVQVGLSAEAERELWLRWLQFATWSPTLRDHYGDHPIDPIDMWKDAETTAAYRAAARIHSQLWPYLYTLAAEASQTGMPLIRYMPLEVPDDSRAWKEERSYFLGSDLLVAPVVAPGATTQTVYLPAGRWADFWSDTVYEGGQDVTVAAPLDGGRAPVFIRAGAILPLAGDHDSLVAPGSADAAVRTYDGDLTVRIAAGGSGTSSTTLYDGTRLDWDGVSTLRVFNSPRQRAVTLQAPTGQTATARVDSSSALLQVATRN